MISIEASGNAVIDPGGGDMITLAGVASTDLMTDDFPFYSDPLFA